MTVLLEILLNARLDGSSFIVEPPGRAPSQRASQTDEAPSTDRRCDRLPMRERFEASPLSVRRSARLTRRQRKHGRSIQPLSFERKPRAGHLCLPGQKRSARAARSKAGARDGLTETSRASASRARSRNTSSTQAPSYGERGRAGIFAIRTIATTNDALEIDAAASWSFSPLRRTPRDDAWTLGNRACTRLGAKTAIDPSHSDLCGSPPLLRLTRTVRKPR